MELVLPFHLIEQWSPSVGDLLVLDLGYGMLFATVRQSVKTVLLSFCIVVVLYRCLSVFGLCGVFLAALPTVTCLSLVFCFSLIYWFMSFVCSF